MKKIQLVLAVIVALGLTDQALAATYFTNESTFNTAAAGFGARTVESFEGTPSFNHYFTNVWKCHVFM